MSAASNYLEEALLNHLFRTTTYTQPTVLAIALCTATPGETDTGSTITEVANSNNYSRQTLNPADANWTDPSAGTQGETDNASAITFGPASGSWGTITSFAICDSATYGAGNMLIYGDLDASKAIGNGDSFSFSTGNLNITLS